MDSTTSDSQPDIQDTLQSLQNQIDNFPKTPSQVTPAGPTSSSVQLPNVPQGQGSNLNADLVDGINANTKPMPGCLYPLGPNGLFSASVIPTSGSGSGFLLGNGLPTDKNILIADGSLWQSRSVSGDITLPNDTGTLTVSKVNGVSYSASPSTNTVPVVTSSNTITYETVPNVALSNSSLTIGSTSLSLGSTTGTISGITQFNFSGTSPINFTGSGSTFNVVYEAVSIMNGTNKMLSITAANSNALKTYFTDTTGGSRLWVWDPTQSMPNLFSTGIPPTFAVWGDILVGDIHCIETNPMTIFMRTSTTPYSSPTQLFSNKAVNDDYIGGAGIVYAPVDSSAGATSDGYVNLIAYGRGSGSLANTVYVSNRSGVGTVQNLTTFNTNGLFQKVGGVTVTGANPVATASSITLDYSSIGRIISNGASSTYGVIQFGSSNNTTTRIIQTIDGTNQRIGVLQGSPAYTLDVSGDVNTTGVYRINGTALSLASLTGVVPIANGGTNSSTALSGNSIIISDGSHIVQGAAGTTTTVLHGNGAGSPSYGAVVLTTDVSGILPRANLAPVSTVLNIDAAAGTGCAANTSENTLKTYTLPGATLVNDGDTIRITCTYRCASNTDTKRIRLYFGATVTIDSGITIINGDVYTVIAHVSRTGASSQITYSTAVGGTVGSSWITNLVGDTTFVGASETLSGSIIIKSTVQLGAVNNANDVIQDQFLVEYLSAGTHS